MGGRERSEKERARGEMLVVTLKSHTYALEAHFVLLFIKTLLQIATLLPTLRMNET